MTIEHLVHYPPSIATRKNDLEAQQSLGLARPRVSRPREGRREERKAREKREKQEGRKEDQEERKKKNKEQGNLVETLAEFWSSCFFEGKFMNH